MNQEQVKDFTRRISQSNRGGLVVVVYDIIFAYLTDAKECHSKGDYEGFRTALLQAGRGVEELMRSLNFQYAVSKNLYALYVYAKESLAKAVIRKSIEDAGEAEAVLAELYTAFQEAAKQDHSKPLMQNTQQVYAGFTYGRNHLNETFQEPDASRGFFA